TLWLIVLWPGQRLRLTKPGFAIEELAALSWQAMVHLAARAALSMTGSSPGMVWLPRRLC
ncbi:MAG: hypothetical protein ABI383_15350, partial [Acidobacteriaceae bacterium]